MNHLSDFEKYFTHETKQERGHARVEKILDAVENLAEESPHKKIDARSIAKKAFISIGAIYHHCPSIQSIFASLLIRKVQARLRQLTLLIDGLGTQVTLDDLTTLLIDQGFNYWGSKSLVAKKEALRFFYKNAKRPELFYSFAQDLYPHAKAFIDRNNTNTIRDIPEDEWPLLVRLTQTAIISPFVEQLHIAGTDVHKKIVKDIILRLYSK